MVKNRKTPGAGVKDPFITRKHAHTHKYDVLIVQRLAAFLTPLHSCKLQEVLILPFTAPSPLCMHVNLILKISSLQLICSKEAKDLASFGWV